MVKKSTLELREEKKILMIEHYAFATIINEMDPALFNSFSVNNGYGAIEDITGEIEVYIGTSLDENLKTVINI